MMPEIQAQLRKSHTKSRLGCSACKQRHQKCDETRPVCVNCQTARRHCPYLDEIPDDAVPAPTSVGSSITPGTGSSSAPQNDCQNPPIQLVIPRHSNCLLYIDLLQHWLCHTYKSVVGPRDRADAFSPIVFNNALSSSFLMQSLLAVAALHKATKTSGQEQEKYRAASSELQAEGLTEFSSIVANLNEQTIIPGFLFAFVTGIHRLAQALREDNPEQNLLASLIDAMSFLRGVNAIIDGWWPFLGTSELRVLFAASNPSSTVNGTMHNEKPLSHLWNLIKAVDMQQQELEVYQKVIERLQSAYSEIDEPNTSEDEISIGFVVVWMITMPLEFIQYLKEGRPLALVILAHCAPSLHYRRTSWAVGDSGKVLFDVIKARLAEEWQTWLDWPNSIVNTN